MLGGVVNASGTWKFDPMLVIDGASASFTIGETSLENAAFQVIVEETRDGVRKRLSSQGLSEDQPLPDRVGGVGLPLYTGYQGYGDAPGTGRLPAAPPSGK